MNLNELAAISKKTQFSADRKYRYTLWREWNAEDWQFDTSPDSIKNRIGFVQFIGLNPSTADETQDDPTIRRCVRFAKDWGYGAMCMTNIFAFRATDPEVMKVEKHPSSEPRSGPGGGRSDMNLDWIRNIAGNAGIIVAAWGKHGGHNHQGQLVKQTLQGFNHVIHHLGLNGDGTPKHPLYLKATTKPQIWK